MLVLRLVLPEGAVPVVMGSGAQRCPRICPLLPSPPVPVLSPPEQLEEHAA